MTDPRDYKLDISSLGKPGAASKPAATSKPFLSVLFECCGVYQRIYKSPDGKAYRGACPRCGLPVNFAVGESGTSARFFRVSNRPKES
jgi:hypothetical protein